ncbi:MAG: helix-turn-helix domain-containing protein [Dermatophilaceae bacterium]
MSEIDRNLRSSQVADAVGLSAASIQAYARKGRIPYRITPGRQYRFNLEEVRQLLAPEALTPTDDLADVFTAGGPIVDALSGYRPDPVGTAALRRLRARAVRTETAQRPRGVWLQPADGSVELDTLIARSGGAAVAVLHRSA